MRYKGKIDLWFWIVMLAGEAIFLGALLDLEGGSMIGIIALTVYNVTFLPFVFRNYVEITDDKLILAFGFSKECILLSEIEEVYQTHNPIASSAASLDRIVIVGRKKRLMCAVKEKEKLFSYLSEKNPNITMNLKTKKHSVNKLEKGSIIFCLVIFAIAGVLLFTGDIEISYQESSFTIEASYWYDKEVAYDEIDEIEYRDEKVSGSRIGGFGSFRLLLGDFKNDEFGNYTRYTYKNCEAGVVLWIDGRELVISGKDKESTRMIYEELVKRCER